ncbi:MAG: hypothetical protein AMXMBFR25_10000 [Lysobacterales bacterium]|nr:Osmolarity sensor protein EnvZ [Xanthomonadales bacterium]
MSSSPTEPGERRGWRTVHLLLAALLGFLAVLTTIAVLLLQQSAMMPSVRQLGAPLLAIVDLVDASDAGDPHLLVTALKRRQVVRAAAPVASASRLPVPFLEALADWLRAQSGRRVEIERAADGSIRLWIASAHGDWLGIPVEPLRSLVARFALAIMVLALLLATLAAWWLARRLAAPVERLAAIAARLPEPVDAQEFRVSGPREIRLLGARLAQALGRIDTQRREHDLLLAGLSHDLRTPLMRLLLRVDLLEDLPEGEREALHADIGELDRRIDRFIEHARTGAEEPLVILDLAALLCAAITSSRARGYDWILEAPPAARVRGQPGVLARLLDNLVDNAEQHGAPPFAARLAADAGDWRLDLVNGMRAADESGDGPVAPHRGFGLALCRHIARSHGGRLEYSVEGHLHRVRLWLPGLP